jgi:hypothetical protein
MTGLVLAALLGGTDAHAGVRRVALLVANNQGAAGSQPLYYAQDDAMKMESVLIGVGGYEPEDVHLVLGRDRRAVTNLYAAIQEDIAMATAEGDEAVFLFYYSGHADADGLQLGDSRLEFDEIEALLDLSGADVRLAFVDACNSGSLTRRKGATRAPSFVFDVSERLGAEGSVIITSSSSDEASQESDEIAGSYFTHYLISGMSGFADGNGDNKVTLGEAYEYLFYETVVRTSQSSLGTQHPTYEWDLSGQGDIVLVDLEPATSTLVFPGSVQGTFAVFDLDDRTFLGEVTITGDDRRMALSPGTYLIQVRYPSYLKVAEVKLRHGDQVDLGVVPFESVSYDNDKAKGMVDARVKKAKAPSNTVLLDLGGFSPSNTSVAAAYFPAVLSYGVSYRMVRQRRSSQFWGLDLSGGSSLNQVAVPSATAQALEVRNGFAMAGVSLGWATRERPGPLGWIDYQAGVGIRMGALFIDRNFVNGEAPYQWGMAPAPGGNWFATMNPGWPTKAPIVFEIQWRSMLVPYALSSDKPAFLARQVTLSTGFRF